MSLHHKREPKKVKEREIAPSFLLRRKMKFYHITDAYIDFLRSYDSKVAKNKHESIPYVGVVVQINDIKYYALFTSPKEKHLKMKNGKDFRKIQGGQYGAINFNNMIPVPESALILIDIKNESDLKYRRLLQNQYKSIIADLDMIITTASKLRKLVLTDDKQLSEYDRRVKSRCCNLKVLESIYTEFEMLD